MKLSLPFELKVPVLYVNPTVNADTDLVEEVSRAGGLGIVDQVASGADSKAQPEAPYGVRVPFKDLGALASRFGVVMALIPLEDVGSVVELEPGALKDWSFPVFVEVGSGAQAQAAERAGAAGLIARGNEGPGWVSETCGFVLLQEILGASGLPVFLRGGLGLRTAAGAIAAGAAGVVLDVHLLLTDNSTIPQTLRQFIQGLGFPTTVTLAEASGTPLRVYSRVGTKTVRELRKIEESIPPQEVPSHLDRLRKILANPIGAPDSDEVLLPLSEDISIAKRLAEEFRSAGEVIAAFGRATSLVNHAWPFAEESPLCLDHGTRFPIVQGPMAHVSDNPDFLAAVAHAGALPFMAMGNMPEGVAREGLALAREKTQGNFGVGLIGLEVNRPCYERHLEIMKQDPPRFAILAAGSVDLARRIEDMGTGCYFHCPAPSLLSEALKAGLRRFVFEGCESGGHIGTLGSLDLWNANLNEIESAADSGLPLDEVRVLFAGGIASPRASAFLAGVVGDLTSKGLKVGLQMGTAYLATEEVVSTCAITPTYQTLTLESDRTAVIGATVNTRARTAASPMATALIRRELERLRTRVPLRERKELYEKDNLGALRLASKGCAIDPETATWDCPVFCDLPPEQQLERGLYLMGQVVSLLEKPFAVEQLHTEIIEEGCRIFETSSLAARDAEVELKEVSEPVVEVEHHEEPIAVVGIGLRFPGSDSPETFWEQIVTGRSGIREVPAQRWGNPDLYYDPDPKAPDKTYSRIGGFITEFQFDPLKYRIPPAVARKMDRTQQMAVACVADALADAALSPEKLKGRKVGIILGNSMGGESTDRYAERVNFPRTLACLEESLAALDLESAAKESLIESFRHRYLADLPDITEDSLPGELANVISGRVANVFNLEGPNFTVDAACASSMAAVMNAVAALRDGKIDYAVSGGVDASMHPSSFVKFCKIGALSPDGSRPFDESANGFVMGEGAGVMILRRLSDALRDGDRIYGTIIGIGSSSDGRGKGITAPNEVGQQRAIRNCLDNYNIDPTSIGLIEAHGTSTPVGDKTELTVVDKIFKEAGLAAGSVAIGSVKSQIGHLKAAAGAAGMIKVLLSLHHRTLPPTINVAKPNRCIKWESSPLFLSTETRPWEPKNGYPRRAGVSAFGFGGTNFHVVFQEHTPRLRLLHTKKAAETPVEFVRRDWPQPPKMQLQAEAWVIGGSNQGNLAAKAEEILRDLTPANAAQLAAAQREQAVECQIRCGFAAEDADAAAVKLTLLRDGLADPAKMSLLKARGVHVAQGAPDRSGAGIAFLFPGQGSQYPFMLRDLAERFPVVAQTLQEADEILLKLGLTSVTEAIFPATDDGVAAEGDSLKDTQRLQPMILTASTAIFRLLSLMGVIPAACAGHSLGEYAACVAAGVFSFRDALEAVAVRGREMARVSIADPGLMMSIPADARIVEEALAHVDGYVVAANKNSPKQTVISGETAAVKKAAELFAARGLEGILLPVSAAFHSGIVAPAREPFMKTLEKLTVKPPSVPVMSNVTGDFYPVGPAAPARIRDLLGKQFAAPVEWVKSLRRLYSEGIRIFLECGPKRVLTNLTQDTLPADVLALPSNHPKKGGMVQLMESLAALIAEGVSVDFAAAEVFHTASKSSERQQRVELKVVRKDATPAIREEAAPPAAAAPHPLEGLLDEEVRRITSQKEFSRFLEIQGEPIRALIKSGFETFVTKVLPLEKTAMQVKTEGMDFAPVVVSGIAAGLPSDVRFPFDRETLDELIQGRNYIKKVRPETRQSMLEKNVERLVKGPSGEVATEVVDDISGVIKLAGFFTEEDIVEQYGFDDRVVRAMDVTTRLAIAAGLEAIKDAGIPLVRLTRTTTTGGELPDSWALPPDLRQETGIIFASAFPGMASLVDEVTRQTAARYGSDAKKRLIDFYTGLVGRVQDDKERERITQWFAGEFSRLNPAESDDLYTFNRDFLLKVIGVAHGQLAQFIKAQGPATHVDAACAGTTQAILVARDWIRTGQAKRVIVIAADDAAGKVLFPWVGSGFLAMGAATTNGNIGEAALPFDDRRHGLIIGSAAAGIVLESRDLVEKRGMEPIAAIETGVIANSGFHGTRLDVEHISSVLQGMIGKWEAQSGLSRDQLARDVFFMSHETYSPKRGGSSAAEVRALRDTFGEQARSIPIANTKGFTGHTMGAGVEDVVAVRCLQKRMLPPIPNLKQPDPEFSDLNLSRGGPCKANYALRLAAGFGSQVVVALYKAVSHEENRIVDLATHRNWLKAVTGYADPVVSVEERTLRVSQRLAGQPADDRELAARTPSSVEIETVKSAISRAVGSKEVREKILSLLAEKTGYPSEMLDTGLDLEADLGIDTVKQAEFISEVRDAFDIPRIEGLKIADFPTIEHIINFVLQHIDRKSLPGAQSADTPEQPDAEQSATYEGRVREKILSLLAEKTGYPADMLDPGLDLEADLGIDTVKQAEFISEIREAFNIPRIEGLKIADFPTINHIIAFVIERTNERGQAAESRAEQTKAAAFPVAEAEVRLLEARLVHLPPLEAIPLPAVDEVIIAGGPSNLVKEMEAALRSAGYDSIVRIKNAAIPKESTEKSIGIINLFPMENEIIPRKTFELCLSLAAVFEQGPVFLVSAVSEDGAYGFENPTAEGYKAGIVAGATKSLAREYPDARVRVLDLHPDIARKDQAKFILRSLQEGFPLETAVAADGRLSAIRLVPHAEEIPEPGTRHGDVVLASGGAGGITAACIRRLAEQHPLTFVILDRTSLSKRSEELAAFGPEQWEAEKKRIVERMKREGTAPTPVMVERELGRLKAEADAFRNIRELKALGSEVIFRSLDIRDGEAVDSAIKEAGELCGRIDVVIHAAGIDISRALKSKSIEQIENVVSVKVEGMQRILEALKSRDSPPRRIVGFGSVAGRFGNLAQIDYSAANDGLAHMLRWADKELDAKASIIDWAPWSQIGMATRGSVQLTLEAAGIDFVSPQQGVEFLFREVGRASAAQEMMAAGRMGPFAPDAFEVPGSPEIAEALFAAQQARIESIIPGEYVRAKIALDPSHPLLNHHRIDRAAVLPGVGGMEIMRAAAALLNPEAKTARFEQVRFQSPLKIFKNEPFEAEVEITRSAESSEETAYHCRIISWFADGEGRKMGSARLHHQCKLVVSANDEGSVIDFAPWREQVRVVNHDIYSVFFHGPAFRFLDHVTVEGNAKAVRFRYADTKERAATFTDPLPGAIEAAFQAAAAFAMESQGIMALPTGIGSAVAYSFDSLPRDGELVPREQATYDGPEGRAVLKFDGVIRDRAGRTLIQLEDVEMVELETSKGFPSPVFEQFLPVAEVVKELEKRPKAFVKENLDKDEAHEHASKTVPKRANEWITGRVALKRTVRRAFNALGEKAPAPNSIRIVQDELGNPSAEIGGKAGSQWSEISLSHSNGLAFAAASVPGSVQGLGVDIEKVESRNKTWVNDYFTPKEQSLAQDKDRRWIDLTKLWSLKEAAVKALGAGLRFDLRDIEVTLSDDSGSAKIEFQNEAAERLDGIETEKIDARVEEQGEYVVARVMIRK
ncbi:MAG TPA: SDR family NAD(P)-dependent oxidoreductase [Desulfomonilaceae bacterium]|nr:SDR family NAD(P)-dependent oxidoreductase [Desulfomonilaceae bacterium]